MNNTIRTAICNALDFIADTWLPLGVVLMCFAAYLIG